MYEHPPLSPTTFGDGTGRPGVAREGKNKVPSGLPSALLVTVHAQLLAPFVSVDFCFAAFLE
jgi:hypothetical protein